MSKIRKKIGFRAFVAVLLSVTIIFGSMSLTSPAHATSGVDPLLGEIRLFPYNNAPLGWEYCYGQSMEIQQNAALYSVIGVAFGGNGTTHFKLPDLRAHDPLPGVGYYIATSGLFPNRFDNTGNTKLGEIKMFPYSFEPAGWLPTTGQELPIDGIYEDLYGVLGSNYGGISESTFKLPTMAAIVPQVKYYIATFETGVQKYIGEISMFPYVVTTGVVPADGRALSISSNASLYQSLGSGAIYGKNQTEFYLPDLSTISPSGYPNMYYMHQTGALPNFQGSAPTTISDNYNMNQNSTLSIGESTGVKYNDVNASVVSLVTNAIHGTVALNSNGAFTYKPNTDYAGMDSFTYKASNSYSSSAPTTVTITVNEVPPVISGVTDGDTYESKKTITFDKGSATLNGDTFISGNEVKAPGEYTLIVTSPYNHITTINFSIEDYLLTVEFNSNNETSVDNQTVQYNTAATPPTALTKTGYTFGGWFTDIGLNTVYNFATGVTDDITLYAGWTSILEEIAAVDKAELYQTQISVNEAYEMLDHVSNGTEKVSLMQRLTAVQAIIDHRVFNISDLVILIHQDHLRDINQDDNFDNEDVLILLQRISPVNR
jgi:uncharacterized repeat protein (TIGR02543 family)